MANKKHVVQDVIPPKRSIRDIELPRDKRPAVEHVKVKEVAEEKDRDFEPELAGKKGSKPKHRIFREYQYDAGKKSQVGTYILLGFLIVAAAFGVSAFFKSAKVTVTPKTDTKTFSETFTAIKDSTQGLGFQLVTISKDAEKTMSATGQKPANVKARGTIVIFNNYGPKPQKLVATTRFQTPESLIFRLINPVTVPGQQIVGAKTIAGSVEVAVQADQPGDSYNIGLKDFTIPGFKGDPKYQSIYARSKTPMTGGFSGLLATVSSDAIAQADSDLSAELKTTLTKDLSSQIPANFVLYPESMSFSFNPVSQASGTTGSAVLHKTGSANAIIFDRGTLSRAILSKISTDTQDTINITNLQDLNFAYTDPNLDISRANTTAFTLNGSAHLVWVFDQNKLKSDLLGLSKSQAESLIATYPAIKEAWIETKPFWNQTIPSDSTKVTLVNTVGQ